MRAPEAARPAPEHEYRVLMAAEHCERQVISAFVLGCGR